RAWLSAWCDVAAVARGRPFLRPRDDLAGVDAGPELQPGLEPLLQLLVQRPERGAEVGSSSHCAKRVVLVHDRNAEDGHHRVADELLDRPAMPLDRSLGGLEVA